MVKELRDLLRSIGIYDLIFGGIITTVLWSFFGIKSVLFLLGIMLGFINFIINSYATNQLINSNGMGAGVTLLSFVLRVALICGPAIIFFNRSEVEFFIFISGYISQILPIVCCGISLKRREGV